jgi:hypothetical protein
VLGLQERKRAGDAHERRVAEELGARGWRTAPWGQAILPPDIRSALVSSASNLLHFPNLVAAQNGELVAIDCQNYLRSAETGRYAVSRNCVSFGLQFHAAFGIPLYYVFGNLGVLTPVEVLACTTTRIRTSGSYLVSAKVAHGFDDIFGPTIFKRSNR